jgi:hypothetical protein
MEKAITLLNVARARHLEVSLEQHGNTIAIRHGKVKFDFTTLKKLAIFLG